MEHDFRTRFSGLIFDKQDFQFDEGIKLLDLLEHHNGELNCPVRYSFCKAGEVGG